MAEGTDLLSAWEWVDLTNLGAVFGLAFERTSSDNSASGMNTPAYFAMDNLTTSAVPVLAAVWLLGSGLMGLIRIRRKRKIADNGCGTITPKRRESLISIRRKPVVD